MDERQGLTITDILKLRCPLTFSKVHMIPMLLKYTTPTPFLSLTDSGNLLGKAPLAPTGINKQFERMDTTSGSKRSSYTKSDGPLRPRKKQKIDQKKEIHEGKATTRSS